MGKKEKGKSKKDENWRQFQAEAEYAESILRTSLGDSEAAIASLEHALELIPIYAPAILSMGSVEYQRGRTAEGRKLFLSLLALPDSTPELCDIIDEAGSFLIQIGAYADGLELYRQATVRFPGIAALHQGIGCCAGHEGLYEEAITTSQHAIDLEPENQEFVNDLGWTFIQAGELQEAKKTLERAGAMDSGDELARENLRYCEAIIRGDEKLNNA